MHTQIRNHLSLGLLLAELSMLFLFALAVRADTGADEVVAAFEKYQGCLTNAEAIYLYKQNADDPSRMSNRSMTSFVGHWFYGNGKELIDFRGDDEALSELGQDDESKAIRKATSQRIFMYDSNQDYSIFYNPQSHTAQVNNGRRLRGWPPSEFMWRVTVYGEKIVDLIKSNKTARLLTPLKPGVDPIIIACQHPRRDWAEYEISLSPSKGYRPVKIQISNTTAHRVQTFDIEPVLANSVWFPAEVQYQDKHADGKGDVHVDWMCTEVDVNSPTFDAAQLDVPFRKGTEVGDFVHNKTLYLQSDKEIRSFIQSLTQTQSEEKKSK
jgi:hypothetical protein